MNFDFKNSKVGHINIPIVTIFNVLLCQLPSYGHFVPVRALGASCALTPNVETADMCSVPFVIGCCSLKLQNSVTGPSFPVGRFIIYTSSSLHTSITQLVYAKVFQKNILN